MAVAAATQVAAACGAGGETALLDRSSPAATPEVTVLTAPATPTLVSSPAGVVVPVLGPAEGGGWTVRTPCHRVTTVVSGTPVGAPAVVLDPGHGGSDPGAVSPDGAGEAAVNLAVAGFARAALEAEGVATVLTRTGDYAVSLPTRAEIARVAAPRAFVSIHHNAEPDGPWPGPGTETFHQIGSPESRRLAGLIHEEVVRALGRYQVAWVADRDAGAKYRPGEKGDFYAVLRLPAPVVSVLAELAFISNPPEAALLARTEFRQVEGEAVARAILRWLRTPDPGSGFTEPYPRPDPPGSGGGGTCRDPQL